MNPRMQLTTKNVIQWQNSFYKQNESLNKNAAIFLNSDENKKLLNSTKKVIGSVTKEIVKVMPVCPLCCTENEEH